MPITGSQCSDRHEVKPWALFGGAPGGNGGTFIQKAGRERWTTVKELYGKVSTSKYANVRFDPGDRVLLLITPGGGGYGDPRERDPARVAEDVREGYVTADAADREYGHRAEAGRAGAGAGRGRAHPRPRAQELRDAAGCGRAPHAHRA